MDPSQNDSFDSLTSAGGAQLGGQPAMGQPATGGVAVQSAMGDVVERSAMGESVMAEPTVGQPVMEQPVQTSDAFVNTNMPVSTGTGDIVLSNDSGGSKKKWIIAGVVVGLLVIIGVVSWIALRPKVGESDGLEPQSNGDGMDLVEALHFGTDDEWSGYYKSEMERIDESIGKTNDEVSLSSLRQQRDCLDAFNVYRTIEDEYGVEKIVGNYLKTSGTLENDFAQTVSGIKRFTSSYLSNYYDVETQRFATIVSIAKRYDVAGCYDEKNNLITECESLEDTSDEMGQLILKLFEEEKAVDSAVQDMIEYYNELDNNGGDI